MKNIASILGFILPSALCVSLTLNFRHSLQTTQSGEVAAGLIAGGMFSFLILFALSCIPNVACTIIAARKKEPFWKLSAFGIPLCAVLTVLTVIMTK